jgi:tetratricopeptide (TPR) repeat protein
VSETLTAFRERIEAVIDGVEANVEKNRDDIQATNKELTDDLHELDKKTATGIADINAKLDAAVHLAKVIGTIIGIVVTILIGAGFFKSRWSDADLTTLQTRIARLEDHNPEIDRQFKDLKETTEKQYVDTLKFVRDGTIERIDVALYSRGTIDALSADAEKQINRLVDYLKTLNARLGEADRSNYYNLPAILDDFREEHYLDAETILSTFTNEDMKHFGYSYMRGAIADRRGDPVEALRWFVTAHGFGEPMRLFMADNAIAVANLGKWKLHPNDDQLTEVKRELDTLIANAPQYAAAHFNLACVYAQMPDKTANVSQELRRSLDLGGNEAFLKWIQVDLSLQTEQFLTKYTHDVLNIADNTQDPNFKNRVIARVIALSSPP